MNDSSARTGDDFAALQDELAEAEDSIGLLQDELAEAKTSRDRWMVVGAVAGAVALLKLIPWAWDQSPSLRVDQRWSNWRAGKGFVRDDEASVPRRSPSSPPNP